jgi:uncharacterized protein YqjF (DUF2071 family)
MKTHFLRAEWNNLVMANYVVPKEILLPYIPYKTEFDFFEGETYVSLVGFMFLNTKVFGLSIPLHENFEEVNLRFYVKYNNNGSWEKGVVFIKEIVPKRAISFIANYLYGENYATMNMKHFHTDSGENFEAGYEWNFKNKWNKISAVSNKRSQKIIPESCESFFADHYWGYSKSNEKKSYKYYVEHPIWETLKVISYEVDCDFGSLYGDAFKFLNTEKPKSVLMTKGSQIGVQQKKELV